MRWLIRSRWVSKKCRPGSADPASKCAVFADSAGRCALTPVVRAPMAMEANVRCSFCWSKHNPTILGFGETF